MAFNKKAFILLLAFSAIVMGFSQNYFTGSSVISANEPAIELVKASDYFSISTSHISQLNKRIHGTCIVGINYINAKKGNPVSVDVANNPYLALFDSLRWQIVEFTGDASAHLNRLKINDTSIAGGNGYNCSDCAAKNSPCCSSFGKDFYNEDRRMLRRARVHRFDYTANLTAGTIDEALWACKNGAGWVEGELELSTKQHAERWPDGESYVREWQKYIDAIHQQYPNVVCESDAAPIWSRQDRDLEWNDALTKIKGDGSKRMYLWDDDCFTTTNDWNYNLKQINEAYDETYPSRMKMMLDKFKGDSINIAQWGMKNFQQPALDNTMAGAHLIVKAYALFVSMPMINNAFYMSMKSLINKDINATTNYNSFYLAGKFFAGCDSVVNMSMPDGLAGVIGRSGKDYYILVSNQTGSSKTYSGVKVDNNVANVEYHTISFSAQALSSTDFNRSDRTEKGITLDNYSVSLIHFRMP